MIEIYGTANCVYCERAKVLCDDNNLEYVYKALDDKENGLTFMEEFTQKVPGAKTVPQIFWHGRHIGGHNDFAIELDHTREFGQGGF